LYRRLKVGWHKRRVNPLSPVRVPVIRRSTSYLASGRDIAGRGEGRGMSTNEWIAFFVLMALAFISVLTWQNNTTPQKRRRSRRCLFTYPRDNVHS
jgi:hypothetical protein